MQLRPATHADRDAARKKLLVTSSGIPTVTKAEALADFLEAPDVLVYNNSSVLPASLMGRHENSGAEVELRLAALSDMAVSLSRWLVVIWEKASWKIRTEHRRSADFICKGDQIEIGSMKAEVLETRGQGLFVVEFSSSDSNNLRGILEAGAPIQYSHLQETLRLWDVQTIFAGPAISVEPPSAAFILSWECITKLTKKGVHLIPITHAAGISSIGTAQLDQLLPFPEWSYIPEHSAQVLNQTKAQRQRVIALGTTVVRCLESAHRENPRALLPGWFRSELKLGPTTPAEFVDGLITGLHEEGEKHFDLEQAFISREIAVRANAIAAQHGFFKHEFGDFHFLLKSGNDISCTQPDRRLCFDATACI